jgi:hypothetical protein
MVRLSKGATEVRCSGRHYFTGGKNWKTTRASFQRSPVYSPASALGSSSALSGRRERTDRNVIPVWISERELLGLSVRIYVWLLFEPGDERACPLKCHVEIIDAEEQQEPVAGCPVIRGSSRRDARGCPICGGRARQSHLNRGFAQSNHGQEG